MVERGNNTDKVSKCTCADKQLRSGSTGICVECCCTFKVFSVPNATNILVSGSQPKYLVRLIRPMVVVQFYRVAFSVPLTLVSIRRRDLISSCTHRYRVSMWRTPPRPIRRPSVSALLLPTKCSISANPPQSRRRD